MNPGELCAAALVIYSSIMFPPQAHAVIVAAMTLFSFLRPRQRHAVDEPGTASSVRTKIPTKSGTERRIDEGTRKRPNGSSISAGERASAASHAAGGVPDSIGDLLRGQSSAFFVVTQHVNTRLLPIVRVELFSGMTRLRDTRWRDFSSV